MEPGHKKKHKTCHYLIYASLNLATSARQSGDMLLAIKPARLQLNPALYARALGVRWYLSIRTLRPEKLTADDVLNLSGYNQARIHCPASLKDPAHISYQCRERHRKTDDKGYDLFPKHAQGFLYYHSSSTHGVLGSIRFRLADSPASFAKGTDLLLRRGAPWSIPLINIAKAGLYKAFRKQLCADELVDEKTMLELASLTRSVGVKIWSKSAQVITALGDTFELDLASRIARVWVLRMPDSLGVVYFSQILGEFRNGTRLFPYTG